jgi:dTDP-4-amino-4,6-dideoxygalactose transaminase
MCCCTVAQREKGLCQHPTEDSTGLDPRYASSVIGFNFKATEFQGALGLTQIAKLNDIIRKRQENVKYINEGLAKHSDVLQLPPFSKTVSYLSYPVVIKDASISRKKFRDALTEAGIESRPLFGSVPTQQPAYAHLKARYEGKVPKADYFGSRGFYIGCHQFMPQEQLDYVITSFGKIIQQLKK